MRMRVKFAKRHPMQYVGHLDFMRFFQKVLRRAHIPVAYSTGYNPHMLMSFALPLGVGAFSEGDYVDVDLEEDAVLDADLMCEKLQAQMVEGTQILAVTFLPANKKNKCMSLVTTADYAITFPKTDPALTKKGIDAFLGQEEILVPTKEEKKKMRRKDVGEEEKAAKGKNIKSGIFAYAADEDEEGFRITMKAKAGSQGNVNPKDLTDALFEAMNIAAPIVHITRLEMYGPDGKTLAETVIE